MDTFCALGRVFWIQVPLVCGPQVCFLPWLASLSCQQCASGVQISSLEAELTALTNRVNKMSPA